MNQGPSTPDALDDILTHTRHLLLSFNGPICPLFAETTSATIADHLRTLLAQHGTPLPAEIEKTDNWQQILTYATGISAQLATSAEAELTKLEFDSACTATPTPHLHEMVTACRESARSLAVVSSTSARVIRTYLSGYSLENAISVVIARTPTSITAPTASQIEQAAGALNTTPATCALVTASAADIDAARHAGAHSIGYARTPDSRNALTSAGAEGTIAALADLTLRLRARRPSV